MASTFDVEFPVALALLPLALLPLVPLLGIRRVRDDARAVASTGVLPMDALGTLAEIAWRACAVATIALIVLALARPGRTEVGVERITRGAELSILLDRSSSMDAIIRLPPPTPGQPSPQARTKNEVVREALSTLVEERPDNRYALTLFNAAPIRVVPFGDDDAIVQAALAASGIGRGPSETEMGLALLAAIQSFEGRAYTGSRAILLVSDGGAKLDEATRRRVSEGLANESIALYFIYIRSSPNSPKLELVGTDVDSKLEEVALHVFFEGLGTGYQVFDADDPESMAQAIERIDAEQNLPLTYVERLPRIDYRRALLFAALACGIALYCLSLLRRGDDDRVGAPVRAPGDMA